MKSEDREIGRYLREELVGEDATIYASPDQD